MKAVKKCCVCNDRLDYLRNLIGQRTGNIIKLFQCSGCGSLFSPSGYKEDDGVLKADSKWHESVFERNTGNAEEFFERILKNRKLLRNYLDVGAGIGSFILPLKKRGVECYGVEPNRYAVESAYKKFGLTFENAYFSHKLYQFRFELITVISVMEHLENPFEFFMDVKKSVAKGGMIFISIPLFHPKFHEKYLENPDQDGTLFFDNDVHISHLTKKAVYIMAEKSMPVKYETLKLKRMSGFLFYF